MKLVTVEEMRRIEREADASGLSYALMMENAGSGLADVIHEALSCRFEKRILGLIGSGNNGGDALVALAKLAQLGWEACACIVKQRAEGDPLIKRLIEAGGKVIQFGGAAEAPELRSLVISHPVLLDGVLGTGARLPLAQDVAQALGAVKEIYREKTGRPYIVAVDCPSGIDCDGGGAAPECLPADLTVTMAAVKQGMFKFPAANYVGEIQVVSIGDLSRLPAWQGLTRFVVDASYVRSVLPERPKTAHKGTFGTALVVAGSVNYTGAALLAGKAAYRCGAGLVTLAVPVPLHAALAGHFPEATWLLLPDEMGVIVASASDVVQENLERATAMLIGPGFGLDSATRAFVEKLFEASQTKAKKHIGFVAQGESGKPDALTYPPCVIDADGLKLIARLKDWQQCIPPLSVLTPHPGEMSILAGVPKEELMSDRIASAEHYAVKWGHVVIFKGAFTVIAEPGGMTAVIPVATPALARAGTGDVLAGLVVGLRAQGVEAFPAAAAAAWIHAQAGLLAEAELGNPASVLAGDVLNAIPQVMRLLTQGEKA